MLRFEVPQPPKPSCLLISNAKRVGSTGKSARGS